MATKAKSTRKTKTQKPAKKTVKAKSPATTPGHVKFGLHGLGKILSAIHEAGLGEELGNHLKADTRFVQVRRKSMKSIKDFVNNKPELSGLADAMNRCDCPAWDPGCVYYPG
jgi:hypothetical protein